MADVSFIVTFYNKSKFVALVLKAIFAQKDIGVGEYIFVDDGSTDDTLELLHKYSEGYENVKIIAQKNAGPSHATNRGIEAATAPYLKFCDGDDILHPRSTVILMNAINKFNVDMAYSQGQETPQDSPEMNAPDVSLISDEATLLNAPLETVLTQGMCNLTCVLASRETVNKAGGCDPEVFFQDVSFLLRMSLLTSFAQVPQALNWCPVDAENRGSDMGEGAQVLHDINLAQAGLFANNPSLPKNLQSRALKRASGRAWKWARRKEGKSILSKYFFHYLTARLFPRLGNTAERIRSSCDAFYIQSDRAPVRRV